MDRMSEDITEEATLTAIIAHGLLGNVGTVRLIFDTLIKVGDSLPLERRIALLETGRDRLDFVTDMLRDLVRGLPGNVVEALEELGSDRDDH